MHDELHNISSDHQDKIAQSFEYINQLIADEHIDRAIELLLELHYADLADFLDNTNRKYYPIIFPAIASMLNAEVLVCMSDGNKQPAIESLGISVSAKLIDELDIEDSIEIIEVLDTELKGSIIAALSADKRQQIIEGFKYAQNSAGRAMEKDYVSLKQVWTAGQAIEYIRSGNISADFHAAIVVDNRFKPVGTILLSTLLKSGENVRLAELMNLEFKVADTNTEVDELAFIFKQYALTIVPVTNKLGKLVGSISIDSMIYIVEEQAENEFLHLGGINNSDIFYNLYTTTKSRFPWLFVNLITACLTSLVINQFSGTISKLITLATIMPIVASMGGNAGMQAMTVTVCALANREITSASTLRVIKKEIYVCALNGFLLAAIGIILTYLLFNEMKLSLVFASAVILNFIIAGFLGSCIPIILNRFNIDPATASGVFLTACTDAIGFFSFLGLAYYFLV